MALTPSTMLALGSKAPDFRLPDVDGTMVGLADLATAPALLVMFICNHCPYVKHVRHELAKLGREYAARGVAVVAINANDAVAFPEDSPEAMAREQVSIGYTFPYLVDATQQVAQAYQAACTPDFFLFDKLDGARPGNAIPVTGHDLRAALDAVLGGQGVAPDQRPSMGCNIKWKPGNAPSYAG
jgi:peroxiredoxin